MMSPQNKREPDIKLISRRTATITNLIHQYVTIGLSIVNGVVLVPLYLKYIDYKLYGAWLATGSIVAWLSMVDAGLSEIVRQQTAQVYGSRNFEQAGKTIGTGLFCNSVVGFLPVLVSFCFAPFLPGIFHLENDMSHSLSDSFILAGISCSLVIISGAATAVLQGLQKNLSVCIIFTVGAIIGLLVTIWMLIAGYGLISIPAGLVLRGIFWLIVYWAYMLYFCYRRLCIRLQISRTDFFKTAKLVSWTFFNRMSREIVGQCDPLVIGLILGVEATPVFVLTKRAWDLVYFFLNRIGVAFMPGLAHLHGEGDFNKLKSISQRLLRIVLYTTAICVGLCIMFNKSFVTIWLYPKSLYAGRTFDILMAVNILTTTFAITVSKILFAIGDIKGPAAVEILQNVLRAILLVLMVWLWGITGAAVSLAVSSGVIAIFYFVRKWIKTFKIPTTEFGDSLLNFTKSLFVSIALSYVFSVFALRNNWVWFIASASFTLLCTIGLVSVLDKEFRAEIMPVWIGMKSKLVKVKSIN